MFAQQQNGARHRGASKSNKNEPKGLLKTENVLAFTTPLPNFAPACETFHKPPPILSTMRYPLILQALPLCRSRVHASAGAVGRGSNDVCGRFH
jgi:hypothetical protein